MTTGASRGVSMVDTGSPAPKLVATDFQLYGRFWRFLRPYRSLLAAGLALIPLMTLAGLAQPYLLKLGIDQAIATGDRDGLLLVSLLLLGAIVAEYVLSGAQLFLLNLAGVRALSDTRSALYRHVMAQGSSFFDRRPVGSLLTRSTSDVEALSEVLTLGVISIFADVLMIVGILTAMVLLDLRLTLLTFSVSPVVVLIVNTFRKKLRHFSEIIRRSLSQLNGYLAENLVGVKVVQLFGREDKSVTEFKDLNYRFLDAYRRSNWYDASLYAIMDGISSVCVALMLWYGGLRHLDGALTVGLLIAFIEYITRIFVPIRELSGKVATLQRAVAALERIFGLLDTHAEIRGGERIEGPVEGSIRFDHVTFRYEGTEREVLRDVSFTMRPRQVTALVGATGSGKTTIGKVLTRTVVGYEGAVTLEGRELSTLDPNQVRSLVGVVQQDVFLFSGSVLENITLGNPAISRERAASAAKLLGAHELIERMGGYDAAVAERGANLSAGQAQLIAFARAMAHDPPILILDEATASIDSMTEAAIQRATERILELKTVLVIAHRLSTIQAADEILVLHRGEIVERGTHASLLARQGRYAHLYETQFAHEAKA